MLLICVLGNIKVVRKSGLAKNKLPVHIPISNIGTAQFLLFPLLSEKKINR